MTLFINEKVFSERNIDYVIEHEVEKSPPRWDTGIDPLQYKIEKLTLIIGEMALLLSDAKQKKLVDAIAYRDWKPAPKSAYFD